MSEPGTLIATLVVFTGTGPLTCRLHHGTDNRIVASVGTRRWRMRQESLARFLAALADDGIPP